MCGLTGMIGMGIISADMSTLASLLHLTMLRGEDSTGLAAINPYTDRVRIEKVVGNTVDFMRADRKSKSPIMKDSGPSVFIGHCRYATKGVVDERNAHPFHTGRYVGAHNGTLVDKDFFSKTLTDSEMMLLKMEKEGVEEVLGALDDWNAYAVSIWDRREKELILARNSQRPLFVGIDQKYDILCWASEEEFLDFTFKRLNIDAKIYYLEPRKVYRIKPRDVKKGNSGPWHKVTTLPDLKKKTYSVVGKGTSTMDDGTPWWEDENYYNRWTSGEKTTTTFKDEVDVSADKANNQNFIKPENSKIMTVPKVRPRGGKPERKVTPKEAETGIVSSFFQDVQQLVEDEDYASRTEYDLRNQATCCVCNETVGLDKMRQEVSNGAEKFQICEVCDEWVEHLDPETGVITPRTNQKMKNQKEKDVA